MMRIICFLHSFLSDWNHGNAHFLRGVLSEMARRGHDVTSYEPRESWSLSNLERERGAVDASALRKRYGDLQIQRYDRQALCLDEALETADLVLVHEWNEPELIEAVGLHRRRRGRYLLLFHDTHHRMVTAPDEMGRFKLSDYDGVLAFGEVLRALYLRRGLTSQAYTWHEAADVAVFRPLVAEQEGDLVWVGNWGDDERSQELAEFLLAPVSELGLRAHIYGVRYPEPARSALAQAGATYRGSVENCRVPEIFARHALTVHVPRRPYVEALVGIPTIRVFEALACGIPLVSSPWHDVEGLFRPGEDLLFASSGKDMTRHLRTLLHEPALRRSLARQGRQTILARHTCAHRVDQLFSICRGLGLSPSAPSEQPASWAEDKETNP